MEKVKEEPNQEEKMKHDAHNQGNGGMNDKKQDGRNSHFRGGGRDHQDGQGGNKGRQNEGRHGRRDRDRMGQGGGQPNNRERKDLVRERMAQFSGPTTNLPSREGEPPKKFTGRCRLFVGNLTNSITDEEFRAMFEKFGEIAEVFLNKQKGFGFVKLDTKQHAEAAKAALDFTLRDGKYLRVRFATHGAALKVKNLSPWVSNELLEAAFSIFGEVERAIVIVDDRGRPIGEGIVEYSRKQAAQTALKRCTEGCFLLTSSPRPVLVEPLEQRDEEDGLPEKNFQKNNKQFQKERDIGPRLAEPGTFEFEFANRWKRLYDVERQKREHLEKEILEGRRQLEDQMEYSIYEHETNMLRERLRLMEEQSSMLQRECEMRREEERRREEQRRQEEMLLRQQEEEILRRRNLDDMRRLPQEDTLMMQANALSDLLDRQEQALRQMQGGQGDLGGPVGGGMGYEMGPPGSMSPGGMMGNGPRQSRFDQPPSGMPPGQMNDGNVGGSPMGPPYGGSNMREGRGMRGGRDMMDRRDPRDDYLESKRRRY